MNQVIEILGAMGDVFIKFLPITLIVLLWGMYELGKEWGNLG